jgi:4-hydroxysphinganine ceramide fatty acyl 2-hydroxylase
MFSHNKWYNIFIVPIAIAIKYGTTIDWTGFNFLMALPFLLLGIFTFSLTEYLLHRFLFHSEKHLFDNRVLRYLHFIMHGIHHMLPVDP